jgi:hypothetical protein
MHATCPAHFIILEVIYTHRLGEICFVLNTLKCFLRFWQGVLLRQHQQLSSSQSPKSGHSEKLCNGLFRILRWTSSSLTPYVVLQTMFIG